MTGERRLLSGLPDLEQLDQFHAGVREDDRALLVVPTPGRGGAGIARDILRALGKRFDLPRTPTEPQTLLRLAALWLRAHRTATLIVRHAETLTPATWHEILQIAPATADAWLWAEEPITAAHRHVCDRCGVSDATWQQLAATIIFAPATAHPMARLAEQVPAPIAPDTDYVPFAIASQSPGNETLFANFVLGRDHAWWHLTRISRRPDQAAVNTLLAHAAHCAPDPQAAIARVRGAQMQLLLAGIHTRIDAQQLRRHIAGYQLSAPDRHAARLLSAYMQPIPAGIAAACLATGQGPGWLTTLTASEIRADQLGTYRVPARLQHLVNMLTLDGVTGLADHLANPERMRRTLDTVMRRTGLRLARSASRSGTAPEWAKVIHLR